MTATDPTLIAEGIIDLLIDGDLSSMPPRCPNEYGFGCDGCRFATLNDCNSEEDVWNDRAEAYFDCALLDLKKVWGESPKCELKDWQKLAREELMSLRAKTIPHSVSFAENAKDAAKLDVPSEAEALMGDLYRAMGHFNSSNAEHDAATAIIAAALDRARAEGRLSK